MSHTSMPKIICPNKGRWEREGISERKAEEGFDWIDDVRIEVEVVMGHRARVDSFSSILICISKLVGSY